MYVAAAPTSSPGLGRTNSYARYQAQSVDASGEAPSTATANTIRDPLLYTLSIRYSSCSVTRLPPTICSREFDAGIALGNRSVVTSWTEETLMVKAPVGGGDGAE